MLSLFISSNHKGQVGLDLENSEVSDPFIVYQAPVVLPAATH